MDKILEITNLSKSYGSLKAVDNISFSVNKGSFFAFLGINGAGKSTTINMISTNLDKDSGSIIVGGYDIDKEPSKIREKIGMVFQTTVLDSKLTVYDNLTIRASFYGLTGKAWKKRYEELSKILSLDEITKHTFGKLSGGQKRRVDIARALINSPEILILDEPTTGLDPQTRKIVWNVIDELRVTTGMTVFVTTHYMEEANNADDVIIIDGGRIAAHGSPIELKEKYSSDYINIYSEENEDMEKVLADYKYRYEGGCYKVSLKNGKDSKDFIIKHQDILDSFEVIKGDMDDVFLQVTGKKLLGEVK